MTAAYERLAGRLLARAAFAITADNVSDAEGLIEAADSLGVLEAEIDLARESLARAGASTAPERDAVVGEEAPDAVDNDLDALASPAQELLTEASEAEPVQSDPDPGPDGSEVVSGESGRSTAMSLEDLGLERFIAPRYPRSAQRRALSGYVEVAFDINPDGGTDAIEVLGGANAEVFGKSASDAVRKWRFAPRPDTVRESIILRFEIAD